MSKLSEMFVKQGYYIKRELRVGPFSTRIWIEKGDCSYMVDFTSQQSLLLSVGDYPGWKKALAAARKICTEFMGAEPLCRYDAKPTIQWTHFMEWDLVHPEQRLRTIVNRGEDLAQIPFRDLQLFGQYRISDFEDATLKQAYLDAATLRQKYPGVFGKDPGSCDVVRVATSGEFELFLEYTLLTNIHQTQQQYQHTVGPLEDLFSMMSRGMSIHALEEQQTTLALDYVLAAICRKLQIAILKEPSSHYRLCVDEQTFTQWFNFNSKHLMELCPDDDAMGKVFKAYQLGEDVSTYAPTGDWH